MKILIDSSYTHQLPSESDADDGTTSSGSGSVTDDSAIAPTVAVSSGSSLHSKLIAVADSDAAKAASASTSGMGADSSGTLKSRLKGKSDAAKKVRAFCIFVLLCEKSFRAFLTI